MEQKVLIIDDEEKIRNILYYFLSDEGYEVRCVKSGTEAINIADEFNPDILLIDQNMPGLNGLETMELLKAKDPTRVAIIITAYGAVTLAVSAIKKGAYDYIEKPFDNNKLLLLLRRAIEYKKLNSKVTILQDKLIEKYSFGNIIANSDEMQKVLEMVRKVCNTDATVLIQGESGVGKELIAQAIHYNSSRKDMPLIAVNCGAIPTQLLESEFFGHEKGSFTDAKDTKIGKFEQSHKGTLFLDEISELPLEAQVKFLRVLEEKKITRIGGKKSIPVDFRLLTATNRNLSQKIQDNSFRLDLLYRINIFTIYIPPLRERIEDIPLLVEFFIQKYNSLLKLKIKSITKPAMELLMKYNWPGNIRDLENAIQCAMILVHGDIITEEFLPIRVFGYQSIENSIEAERNGLEENVNKVRLKVEKEIIINALKKCNNSRTETAKYLNISRKTLFNKMKYFGLPD